MNRDRSRAWLFAALTVLTIALLLLHESGVIKPVEDLAQTVIAPVERALSGLFNGIGDAIGAQVEFKMPGSFPPVTDMVGGGPWKLKAGQWTDRWDPPTAQRQMEQLLTKYNNNVQGVLSANDGMAGGIIAALKAVGLSGKVPVTGQDATVEGVQRIILGTQGQSVLKDFRLQAAAAARK